MIYIPHYKIYIIVQLKIVIAELKYLDLHSINKTNEELINTYPLHLICLARNSQA